MKPPIFNARPKLAFSSAVNLVWAGNSLVQGTGASIGAKTLPNQTAALAPVTGSGAATVNDGISGYSWANMVTGAATIDAAWVNGKTNVLILWETTNSVFNEGLTGLQCIAAAQSYIAARRAVHPWIMVVLTTLPREAGPLVSTQPQRDAANAEMVVFNNYVLQNRASLGADRVVNVRPAGSPFAFANYLPASFDATQTYWYETTGRIHLVDAGYAVIAGYVASVLSSLPSTAH